MLGLGCLHGNSLGSVSPFKQAMTKCMRGCSLFLTAWNVRFGSLADIRERIRDVRFTPKRGHTQPCQSTSAMCQ
jgi:hypothetical protein